MQTWQVISRLSAFSFDFVRSVLKGRQVQEIITFDTNIRSNVSSIISISI